MKRFFLISGMTLGLIATEPWMEQTATTLMADFKTFGSFFLKKAQLQTAPRSDFSETRLATETVLYRDPQGLYTVTTSAPLPQTSRHR